MNSRTKWLVFPMTSQRTGSSGAIVEGSHTLSSLRVWATFVLDAFYTLLFHFLYYNTAHSARYIFEGKCHGQHKIQIQAGLSVSG
jgi:hypothetical protein